MSISLRRTAMTLGLVGVAALVLSACGGDDNGGNSASATTGGGTASAGGVTTQTIDGTDVLVDSNGAALYSPDQEQGGKVLCTQSCTSIWKPVPSSEGAGAPSDLMLGEVDRPDGEKQLTYKGAPLYSFTEEGSGELTGDGLKDSFGNTDFTWHAATTSASSGSSGGGGSGGSSGGGYGY
jgi:predicted lipoprotein with Yx(FWY)xxD motif